MLTTTKKEYGESLSFSSWLNLDTANLDIRDNQVNSLDNHYFFLVHDGEQHL